MPLPIKKNLFESFLMGGFECSTHRRNDKKRVDVIESTRHDEFAAADYQRLIDLGILTARDGVRWHLIETSPYQYDFSSVLTQVRAARDLNVQIIWDLFHYGYPDDLDLPGEEFVNRFASFAGKFTEFLVGENVAAPYLCPVNEISFFSWIAGEVGGWKPYLRQRGDDIKRQLIKASIAAIAAIKSVAPHAVVMQTDPLISVTPSRGNPENKIHARSVHNSQFHALDMILGKIEPELGGAAGIIDAIGVNYYCYNQWRHPSSRRVMRGNSEYKPLHLLLRDFYTRYEIPLFIAETGIEDDARADWFKYVCEEVKIALELGVPMLGICLYPIVNHPGWDDDRHCYNGLWDYPSEVGKREIYEPLAEEIRRQTKPLNAAENE